MVKIKLPVLATLLYVSKLLLLIQMTISLVKQKRRSCLGEIGHQIIDLRCLKMVLVQAYTLTLQVWSLNVHNLVYSFPGEHSKNTIFPRNVQGAGVSQLYLSNSGQLFSCGSDGSMKVRQLPDSDNVVKQWC